MKTYMAFSIVAFGLVCLTCRGLSFFISRWFHNLHTAVPFLTREVLNHRLCFLFLPIPWIIYSSLLEKRGNLTSEAVFTFSGTLFLAGALFVSAMHLPSFCRGFT